MKPRTDPEIVLDLDSDDDAFSLIEVANAVLRQWRMVILLPAIIALGVGALTLTKPRLYAASATFLPQAAEGRTGGGAAALAQQFGVTLGTDHPAQSPQFYVDLLQSRALLRKLVESKFRVAGPNGGSREETLIDILSKKKPNRPAPSWLPIVDGFRNNISASVARQTGVVRLTVTYTEPGLAEQIAERLLQLLNAFNMEMLQTRAEQENRFVGDRLAEAQAMVLAAESNLQSFQRQNRQFQNSPELSFQQERLQREVATRQEVYTSLLRAQEETRIDAMRDTPLITVIDHPAGTAEPQGRGTIARVLLAFLFGLGVAIALAFARESAMRGKESEDSTHREFHRLVRQAWNDFRHPSRWFKRAEPPVLADHG